MNAQQLTRLKVSATYLAIIMSLSIIFSFAIYKISDRELVTQRRIEVPRGLQAIISLNEFDILRNAQLEQARDNLKSRLLTFNMLTLLAGAFLSYYLAIRSLKPIENAFEKQNRFTSDASHEIRTPLTAMKTEIEIALRDKNLLLKDARQVLNSNLEEINRLENLTDSLLKLAKGQAQELPKTKTDLVKIAQQAVNSVSIMAQQKNVKLQIESSKKLSTSVEPTSIEQVMVILLDNAIKYSPPKGKVLLKVSSNRNSCSIKVSDMGAGIADTDLPHVFDRFYRSDKSRTKDSSQTGYGLGLSIAKEIVDQHRGSIQITSKLKSGTTFNVSLPKK